MKAQTVKRMVQIQAWVAQIMAFKQSGQTVAQWCKENGVAKKSFYYHRRRVQEEMLDAYESGNGIQLALTGDKHLPAKQSTPDFISASFDPPLDKSAFVPLSIPQQAGAAISVRLGGFAVDIQNDADSILVEQVLRMVSRL